jgi:hypothetical protein
VFPGRFQGGLDHDVTDLPPVKYPETYLRRCETIPRNRNGHLRGLRSPSPEIHQHVHRYIATRRSGQWSGVQNESRSRSTPPFGAAISNSEETRTTRIVVVMAAVDAAIEVKPVAK